MCRVVLIWIIVIIFVYLNKPKFDSPPLFFAVRVSIKPYSSADSVKRNHLPPDSLPFGQTGFSSVAPTCPAINKKRAVASMNDRQVFLNT